MNSMYFQCIDKILVGGLANGIWTIYLDSQQNIFNENVEFDIIYSRLKTLADSNIIYPLIAEIDRQTMLLNGALMK